MPILRPAAPPSLLLGLALVTCFGAVHAAERDEQLEKFTSEGIELLVGGQEDDRARATRRFPSSGEELDRWPYEGVYRESGRIPIGYEVGGTAIVSLALVEMPGLAEDPERQEAIHRGLRFLLEALDAKTMASGFRGGYDVRGWGHVYALLYFLRLQELELVPEEHVEAVTAKTAWLVQTLQETAIPESGGWNYSRRRGFGDPRNSGSPFMTAPALQALFEAKARGHTVDDTVIDQALESLERARTKSGGMTYSSPAKPASELAEGNAHFMDKLPGAIARMAVVEATLILAGRGSQERLVFAIEKFFEHWKELEKRRRKSGTHNPPYGIAPYYFMYGHYYVAQAIEMVEDAKQREQFRADLRLIFVQIREPSGAWNDRVFERSRNYGTALALMALHMPSLPRPVTRTGERTAPGPSAPEEPSKRDEFF